MGTLFKYIDNDFYAFHALDTHTVPGQFSMHAHRDPEIYCFLGGKGRYRVEGTVYPLLTRMKNEGLLTYRWQESTGGPPRKYYSLTEEGHTLLQQLQNEWHSICQAVSQVTE